MIHVIAGEGFFRVLTAVVGDPAVAKNVAIGILPAEIVAGRGDARKRRWTDRGEVREPADISAFEPGRFFSIWHILSGLYLQRIGRVSADALAMRRFEQMSVLFIMYSSYWAMFYAAHTERQSEACIDFAQGDPKKFDEGIGLLFALPVPGSKPSLAQWDAGHSRMTANTLFAAEPCTGMMIGLKKNSEKNNFKSALFFIRA